MEREDFIKNWLEGKISPEDLEKELTAGNHDVAELKNTIERSSLLRAPQKRSKDEAWDLLAGKLTENKSNKVKSLTPWIYMSIAASIALIIVSYFIFFKPESIITPKGEQLTYTLPDGSQVQLNADSKISYRKFARNERRKVKIKGEAFFDVKEGGPFQVESDRGTVTVLGTRFNVKQRDDILEVTCFTGSVKVTGKKGEVVILKASQLTATKNNQLTEPLPIDEEKAASWRGGGFYFENTGLQEVFSELERQFDVEILYKGNNARNYTGYFNNKDLDEALQLVCAPMALKYQKEGNKITIE